MAALKERENEGLEDSAVTAVEDEESEKKPTVAQEDFVGKENKANMWDSIRSDDAEEDLDVPPTLRAKLRRKK